jgi:UDP-N-acetylmuramate--alanine ligase
MPNLVDFSGRPFHFIGIGGIGMSALAYILVKQKIPVSGSDARSSHITQRLEQLGAQIFWQQSATNFDVFRSGVPFATPPALASDVPLAAMDLATVPEAEAHSTAPQVLPQVVCSTAIQAENPEYQAAVELGCPILHRSDLLAALMTRSRGIAVAGTHGKTTTSSLIGYMLLQAGIDPTIIVGGEVDAWEGNARLGQGPYLVAEADESDGSLIKLFAELGVITNIELDHPDHYQSIDGVVEIFEQFTHNCQRWVGCLDCPTLRDRLKPDISYSLDPDRVADYTVLNPQYTAQGVIATVLERGEVLGEIQLQLMGQHNLSNALAAVAVGRDLGLDFAQIAEGLAGFQGAQRRFEHRGTEGGIALYDDYAHHPSEIRATLAAARQRLSAQAGQSRVVAIFQPHRYSRTQTFLEEFAQSFQDADLVAIADIYAAGEKQVPGLSGQTLADRVAAYHPEVSYCGSLDNTHQFLSAALQPGDLALFLGAGNLNQIVPSVLKDLAARADRATDDCKTSSAL